jgi:hypothetical protein
MQPATSPRRATAFSKVSFWGAIEFEVRLRQISRGLPQHLVLLLQQSVASPQLTHFAPFIASVTGLTAFLDIGLLWPVDQRLIRDPEILRDPRQRETRLPTTSDRDNIRVCCKPKYADGPANLN